MARLDCPAPSQTEIETGTEANKLAQNPMGICVADCLCAQFYTKEFYRSRCQAVRLFYETVCFPGIFDCDTTNVRKSEPEFCTVQLSLRVLFQSVFEI